MPNREDEVGALVRVEPRTSCYLSWKSTDVPQVVPPPFFQNIPRTILNKIISKIVLIKSSNFISRESFFFKIILITGWPRPTTVDGWMGKDNCHLRIETQKQNFNWFVGWKNWGRFRSRNHQLKAATVASLEDLIYLLQWLLWIRDLVFFGSLWSQKRFLTTFLIVTDLV